MKQSTSAKSSNTHHNDDYKEFFLPTSLIKLVMKIAKIYQLSSLDEFSVFETLQFALFKSIEIEITDEKTMTILIINIIRITEKYNKATSMLTRTKLESLFPQLGITSDEFNQQEFKIFEAIDFQVQNPQIVEMIYKIIETSLSEFIKKEFIFEFSVDILRIVYASRINIYDV